MAVQTTTYGTRTALACTLASLANGSYRESDEVDNGTAGAVDGILHGKVTMQTATNGLTFTIYVWGSDGTTSRPGNVTGANAAVTPAGEQTQWEIARIVPVDNTANHEYQWYIGSIAALFGGVMPKKFGVVVLNSTGAAFNATGGNHEINYTPITYTVT